MTYHNDESDRASSRLDTLMAALSHLHSAANPVCRSTYCDRRCLCEDVLQLMQILHFAG